MKHFYITTSGFFSNNALECCIKEMGIDRVMFSIDYPFVDNKSGADWALKELTLDGADKEKLAERQRAPHPQAEASLTAPRCPRYRPMRCRRRFSG